MLNPSCILLPTVLLLSVGLMSCSDSKQSEQAAPETSRPTIGTIERSDPLLDTIVPENAELEILAEGHEWTEGPVWAPALQALLYSDIPNNAIFRWSENEPASVWLQPSGYTGDTPRSGEGGSNGLILDGDGGLVLAQHGDRRIARLTAPWDAPEPVFETIAGTFDGMRFNSPNDVAMKSNGDFYFTDPPYGLEQGMNDPSKEIGFQGVYRTTPQGDVTLLIDDLSRPNGIAFSPDERTLYVANSDRNMPVIMAYDVEQDGGVSNGRIFFDSWGDGIKVDQQGNLYVAGPENGVLILSPEGVRLGLLSTTQATSNCAFGDDGSTLYITSDMYLLRIRLNAKGVGF